MILHPDWGEAFLEVDLSVPGKKTACYRNKDKASIYVSYGLTLEEVYLKLIYILTEKGHVKR